MLRSIIEEISVNNCRLFQLQQIDDGIDGTIIVTEKLKDPPFEIKRVYYIINMEENAIRGEHAHKELEQIIFCIKGSFEVALDDGIKRQSITLDKPHIGVYIGINVWLTMKNFSEDCVILVLASDYYDESDYIRDYAEFKKYINNKKR